MRHQFGYVRSKCIRFDDIDACFYIVRMNLANELRIREIQLIEAPADENAFTAQHRAHCAVADEHALLECGQKIIHTKKNSHKKAQKAQKRL